MAWTSPSVERAEPAFTLPEPAALRAFVTYHRQTLLWKVSGLTGEQLATRSLPSTAMTLLGLVRHLANVEHGWWRVRVAGEQAPPPHPWDHDEDWNDLDPTQAAADLDTLHATWAACDEVAARYELDDEFPAYGDETWSVRTLYLHLIEEYARHNGHADLIREALDGGAIGE